MDIVKLKPATQDYIWGGTEFKMWGKEASTPIIAECWELSFNDDGPSVVDSGASKSLLLKDTAQKNDIGTLPASFQFFPVLIKLINSAQNLSIQVHPSDAYALKNEGQYGKTEMWYIIKADPGCGLYVGFKKKTNADSVRKAVTDGTIMDLLNFVEVKPGDTYFIPSGTVHAIGKGVTLMEIQQNSTLTYRLYDYGRLGKDGKPRELHLEKALKVLNYDVYKPAHFTRPLLGKCAYFASYLYSAKDHQVIHAPSDSFASITFIDGQGTFDHIPYHRGDTFFIPAGKTGELLGTGSFVLTQVEKQ